MVYKHQGNWSCVDHERHLVPLNKIWNENQAFLENLVING